jgi:hypothetical protein
MAKNNKTTAAASQAPSEQLDNSVPTNSEQPAVPGIGLGDLLGDGNTEPEFDTAERHSEAAPNVVARGPAAAAELRAHRETYPAKPAANCGPTVQSLTQAELGNRTSLNKVLCVCPEHHTPCYAGVREGIFTRMYCPVEGCNFAHKMVVPTTAELINRAARREQLFHPQNDITAR